MHNEAYEQYMTKVNNELDETADIDIRLFWRTIRKRKNKTPDECTELLSGNTVTREPTGIVEAFADFYEQLYADSTMDDDANSDFPNINVAELDSPFTFEELNTAIRQLNLSKAPGIDKVTNEHIRYGGKMLIEEITKLFNAIRTYGKHSKNMENGSYNSDL